MRPGTAHTRATAAPAPRPAPGRRARGRAALRWGSWAWVVLAALGLAGAAPGAASDPFEALGLVRFDSGIRAPAFALADLGGREVRIPPPAASATILVFWATW